MFKTMIEKIFIILLITFVQLIGQFPFTKTYSNEIPGRSYIGQKIYQELNGDFVIVGETDKYVEIRYGGQGHIFEGNIFIMKTDYEGDILWRKEYGDTSGMQGAYSFKKTPDNGFIIACYNKDNENEHLWVIKVDENGDSLWTKHFHDYGAPQEILVTKDSNIVLVGNVYLDDISIYMLKLNQMGDLLWSKIYKRSIFDMAYNIQELTNGDLIISATTYTDSEDIWIIKIDSGGDTLWNTIINGEMGDKPKAIFEIKNNNYLLFSEYSIFNGVNYEVHPSVVKMNQEGDILWKKNFFIDDSSITDNIISVIKKVDEQFILVCNSTYPYVAGSWVVDVTLLSVDIDGNVIEVKRINDSCFDNDHGNYYELYSKNIIKTMDGGYAITGTRLSDYYLYSQIFLIKIDENEEDINGRNKIIRLNNCYPNPLNENTIISFFVREESDISLKIYDLQGKEVKIIANRNMQSGSYSFLWDGKSNYGEPLPSGMYIYRLKSDSQQISKKLILLR